MGRLQSTRRHPEQAGVVIGLDRASSDVMRRRVLAATSVSYVVVSLDTSSVNVALDRISVSLATDIAGT